MAFFFQEVAMLYEVIWHGRGGQGVVVAAQMLAEAAYMDSFKGVTATPTFGPERRGSPVTASNRLSHEPVRMFSQVELADISIVLDETLFKVTNVLARQKKGGLVVVNTNKQVDEVPIDDDYNIAVVDALTIALENNLMREGAAIINTPLLGAFARATGLISLESIGRTLRNKLPREQADLNFAAVSAAYERTVLRRHYDQEGR